MGDTSEQSRVHVDGLVFSGCAFRALQHQVLGIAAAQMQTAGVMQTPGCGRRLSEQFSERDVVVRTNTHNINSGPPCVTRLSGLA